MGLLSAAGRLEDVCCDLCGAQESRFVLTRLDGLDVRECVKCGLAFVSPRPPVEVLDAIYAENYFSGRGELKTYDEKEYIQSGLRRIVDPRSEFNKLLDTINHFVRLQGARVLDVGCGYGFFLRGAELRGAHVSGLDVSPEAAEYCRRTWGYPVGLGGPEEIQKESADVATALHVIEHVVSPTLFLRNLVRGLRPGGVLALTTPNYRLGQMLGQAWTGFRISFEHMYYFDRVSLEQMLERVGLKVLTWYTTEIIPPSGDFVERTRGKRFDLFKAKEAVKQIQALWWLYKKVRKGFNAALSKLRVARGVGYELGMIGRRVK
ncbi:MAG: class I SAM-dependent methyltransferase [Candidatus Methylomirabilales bacterium]